jgi:hypothetical protein
MTITIKHHKYNDFLANAVSRLGGDKVGECEWQITMPEAEEYALKLKEKWEGETVVVDIRAVSDLVSNHDDDTVMDFLGYKLYISKEVFGRHGQSRGDYVPKIAKDVLLIADKGVYAGDYDNYKSNCKKDCVFRLRVLKNLLDMHDDKSDVDGFEVALASENRFAHLSDL